MAARRALLACCLVPAPLASGRQRAGPVEFLEVMRAENAFALDPSQATPALMQALERAAPPWNGLVDLAVKGDAVPAQRHVEPVAAAVCQLVQGVLAAEPRELQDMGVVGMLLWADGAGGPHRREDKVNKVLYRVPQIGRCAAQLYEGIATHPICLEKYRRTLPNTGRCSVHFFAHGVTTLKHNELWDDAEAMFQRALEAMGPQLGWSHVRQTPDLVVAGLTSTPWWNASEVPIARVLEENAAALRKDVERLVAKGLLGSAYPALVEAGTWQKVSLFKKKTWDKKACKIAAFTCELLKQHVHIDVPWLINNQEEVVVFSTTPGSKVAVK